MTDRVRLGWFSVIGMLVGANISACLDRTILAPEQPVEISIAAPAGPTVEEHVNKTFYVPVPTDKTKVTFCDHCFIQGPTGGPLIVIGNGNTVWKANIQNATYAVMMVGRDDLRLSGNNLRNTIYGLFAADGHLHHAVIDHNTFTGYWGHAQTQHKSIFKLGGKK